MKQGLQTMKGCPQFKVFSLTPGPTSPQDDVSLLAAPLSEEHRIYNPAGDSVNLADEGKSDSEYTIINFWKFPEGLGLKVNIPNMLDVIKNCLYLRT